MAGPVLPPLHPDLRFHNHAGFLRKRLGVTAARISIDAGFSCPVRDGTIGTEGCAYCSQDAFTPGIRFRGAPVEEQVRRGIQIPGRHQAYRKFLVYFQRGTNTYGPPEALERAYRAAFCHPDVAGIVVGTRPDCLAPGALDVLERIANTHYVLVEIGLQSKEDAVLRRANRGHDVETFVRAVRAVRERGIDVGVHLIYGLPGDSRENFVGTASFLSDLGIQGVKLHHFHVVKGSPFEGAWRRGEIGVPEYGDYVGAVADFLERLCQQVALLRLIGAPSPDFLLAPVWNKGNREMAADLSAELARRDTHQGALRERPYGIIE